MACDNKEYGYDSKSNIFPTDKTLHKGRNPHQNPPEGKAWGCPFWIEAAEKHRLTYPGEPHGIQSKRISSGKEWERQNK